MDEIEIGSGTKNSVKALDRVTLGKEEAIKISEWLKQIEDSSSGFLQLSRSDVVNFLIREHKSELTPREKQQIRVQHYDPIKHLNWITPRLKDALQRADAAAVSALQAEIKSIELSVISKFLKPSGPNCSSEALSSEKPKRRRSKKTDDPPILPALADLQLDSPEG